MTRAEALEVTRIHSVAGLHANGLVSARPFRAPHHTISPAGLVGGGSPPRPGEATLAHPSVKEDSSGCFPTLPAMLVSSSSIQAAARAAAERSAAAQGLPARVEDRGLLLQVARLVADGGCDEQAA
jgi:hypothetical protein